MIKTILVDELINKAGLTKGYACGYMCVVEKVAYCKEGSYNESGGPYPLFGEEKVYVSPEQPKQKLIDDYNARKTAYHSLVYELAKARSNLPEVYRWLGNLFPAVKTFYKVIDTIERNKDNLVSAPYKSSSPNVHTVKLPTHITCVDLDLLQELYLFDQRELLNGKKAVSKVNVRHVTLAEDLIEDSQAIPIKIETNDRLTFIVRPQSDGHGELTLDHSPYRLFIDEESALGAANQFGELMAHNIIQSMTEQDAS